MNKKAQYLSTLFGTEIKTRLDALLLPFLVALGAGIYAKSTQPKRPFWRHIIRIPLYTLAFLLADVVHSVGHILSSLRAEAPIQKLVLRFPMPQLVYQEKSVSPRQHRWRAWGGPLASLWAASLHRVLQFLTPAGSWLYDFWQANFWFHLSLGLGSLLPLPIFDGGSILKWTLIERGRDHEEADETLKQVNTTLGTTLLTFGFALALAKRLAWAVAVIGTGIGLIAFGRGKLKL